MQHEHKEYKGIPFKSKSEEKTITCLHPKHFLFHLFKCSVCFQKLDLSIII